MQKKSLVRDADGHRHVPNVTGWDESPPRWVSVMRHTFPITPQILGPGFIVGCERVVSKVSGDFAPSSDPTYCAGRGRERRRHAGEAASLCVREFDRDGWQASVRRNVAPPASVSLGAAGENAFAVVVPDADCE